MFEMIPYLLAAYGLCFALQNKFPFGLIYGKTKFTDDLLKCTYCLGFHCGWLAYLLQLGISKGWHQDWLQHGLHVVFWGFCGAAFCYAADALVQYLEMNVAGIKHDLKIT